MLFSLKNIIIILLIILVLKFDFKKKRTSLKIKKIGIKGKKRKNFLIILGVVTVIYLITINMFFNTSLQSFIPQNLTKNGTTITYGSEEKIGVGDSVYVEITRNRWYGTIYESGGKSRLFLFNILPLPLKKANTSFIFFHIILLLIWISFIIFSKKETFIKEENF